MYRPRSSTSFKISSIVREFTYDPCASDDMAQNSTRPNLYRPLLDPSTSLAFCHPHHPPVSIHCSTRANTRMPRNSSNSSPNASRTKLWLLTRRVFGTAVSTRSRKRVTHPETLAKACSMVSPPIVGAVSSANTPRLSCTLRLTTGSWLFHDSRQAVHWRIVLRNIPDSRFYGIASVVNVPCSRHFDDYPTKLLA